MNVFVADEQDEIVDADALRSLAELVMRRQGFPEESEVTILLVGSEQIAEYNQRFLDRTGPTDVLAFPLETLSPGEIPGRLAAGPPLNLGDVVIAPAVVKAQAAEHRVDFDDELSLMVVHGLLHLMGWDHDSDPQADEMEARESELLREAGRRRRR